MANSVEGNVFKARSGQWSFRVLVDGIEVCGGAGFDTEDEAHEGMNERIVDYETDVPADDDLTINLRDVVQRMKDKSYSTIGEAFEDIFFDGYFRDFHGVIRPEFRDLGLGGDDDQ